MPSYPQSYPQVLWITFLKNLKRLHCLITVQTEKTSKIGVIFALFLIDKLARYLSGGYKYDFVKKEARSNKNNLRQVLCKQTNFVFSVDFDWKKELMLNRLWPALFLMAFFSCLYQAILGIPKC
jgi:hypothetical protein